MKTRLLDGRAPAKCILDRLRRDIDGRRPPRLVTIVVGRRPDSLLYVRLKEAAAARIGIKTEQLKLPSSISQHRLTSTIQKCNRRRDVTGILLQLPLPSHIETDAVVAALDPRKDVDGLRSDSPYAPPFLRAMIHLLKLGGRIPSTVLILAGNSPLRDRLVRHFRRGVQVIVDPATKKIPAAAKSADAIITFRGTGPRLTARDVNSRTIVIDGGIRRREGQTVGDVAPSVVGVARAVTPVPGGVGPLTIAYLLDNLVRAK